MKNKVNFLLPILLLVSLLVFVISISINSPTSFNSSQGIHHGDIWSTQVYRNATGTWEAPYYGYNTYTDAGKNATRDLLGYGNAGAGFKYVGLGNTTAPSSSSTTLASEYSSGTLTRALGTYYALSQVGNWTISNTFTADADNQVVNTTALFNASSSGVLLAGFSFTSATLQTNDQITINATIWAS